MNVRDKIPMQFPYGAVYFRKSNPPKADWERDYQTAHDDGMNIFRHWFMWGAIETSPGKYDWSDYDRQMDLAKKNGIKTIIAEFMDSVPEWLYKEKPELFYRLADDSIAPIEMGVSCPSGGFGVGPCLDNAESRKLGGEFLRKLAARYKGHPALLGYDIWNETNFRPDVCYCEATKNEFRHWLRSKYGTLEQLGKSWCRYSFSDWSQVDPPVKPDFYMQSLDWQLFRKDNVYQQMSWRVKQIRSIDKDCLIVAHGTAASLDRQTLSCYDDWEAAGKVEVYGLTYVPCRHTGQPWKFWQAVDMTRNAARGKTFWHAEMQGGPLWLQPQVLGRPKEDARIPDADDIRLYNLTSMACGSRGILYPRMRPLLNGPLFGAFGPYAMDGTRTARSDMAGFIAKWANQAAQKELFDAAPLGGEVGILVTTHAQMGSFLISRHGGEDAFSASVWGAYQGFFDNNIQADYVYLEDIDQYKFLYLPYSIVMTKDYANKLMAWVRAGGILISEACLGYFDEYLVAGTKQPNMGMDMLFGAEEVEVEFTPDILKSLQFSCLQITIDGGLTLQTYRATTGAVVGHFADGRVAAVEHVFGEGKTLLIGTHPSEAYFRKRSERNRLFFKALLDYAGYEQRVKSGCKEIKVRLHSGQGDTTYVWALNVSNFVKEVDVKLSAEYQQKRIGKVYWGSEEMHWRGEGNIRMTIPAKDAKIFKLA